MAVEKAGYEASNLGVEKAGKRLVIWVWKRLAGYEASNLGSLVYQ